MTIFLEKYTQFLIIPCLQKKKFPRTVIFEPRLNSPRNECLNEVGIHTNYLVRYACHLRKLLSTRFGKGLSLGYPGT